MTTNSDTVASDNSSEALSRHHRGRLQVIGLVFVTFWFAVGGIGHLFLTNMFASVTPAWAPNPRLIVLVTGVLEIAAAVALWVPRLRWPTGIALMLFCVAVTPVHIDMLRETDRYASLGAQALWARLLFQPVLIVLIFLVTRPRKVSA